MREFADHYGRAPHVRPRPAVTPRLHRALRFATFGVGAAGPCGGMAIGQSATGLVGFAAGGLCVALALWAGLVLARAALVAGSIGLLFLLVFITAPLTSPGVSFRAAAPRGSKPRRWPLAMSARAGLPRAPQAGEWA